MESVGQHPTSKRGSPLPSILVLSLDQQVPQQGGAGLRALGILRNLGQGGQIQLWPLVRVLP